jgi:mRNA interferase RelE/StbE
LVYKVEPQKRVLKYLKKLKDKRLKAMFVSVIYDDIATNPKLGIAKTGDLIGYWTWEFNYQKTAYRVAYKIQDDKIIPIILIGSHENFYQELKRLD